MNNISSNMKNKAGDMHSINTKFLTVDEVAEKLRCSRFTILNWIKDGTLTPTVCLKKRYLIPVSSVESLLRESAQ